MTRPVPLHPIEHKDLRIVPDRGAAWGDDVMLSLTFPLEFRDVQAHYPIVFRKTGERTGDGAGYEALALFGFEEGENLFLGGDGSGEGWDASYVPLAIQRQPFLIGRRGEQLGIHIDLDHPRVSTSRGEALFLRHGGTSTYLERVNDVLSALHEGMQGLPAFIEALAGCGLLEPFTVDIELNDGAQHRLAGFETINEDRLLSLPGATLERLNRAGHLQAIHMAMASLTHLRDLIARKERRHAARG
jgi:hypothetical protein